MICFNNKKSIAGNTRAPKPVYVHVYYYIRKVRKFERATTALIAEKYH